MSNGVTDGFSKEIFTSLLRSSIDSTVDLGNGVEEGVGVSVRLNGRQNLLGERMKRSFLL